LLIFFKIFQKSAILTNESCLLYYKHEELDYIMSKFEVNYDKTPNQKLYEFLAISYDISALASKIFVEKNAPKSIVNLKKIINNNES
jgi:hypothetical protein